MTDRNKAVAMLNASMIIMSFAGVYAKAIPWHPALLIFGRMSIASVALLLYLLVRRESFTLSRKDLLLSIPLSVLLAVHWITFFAAVQVSTVAIGVMSVATIPIITTFIEPLVHRERLTFTNVIIAFIAFVGIAIMVDQFSLQSANFVGILLGLCSALCMSLRGIFSRSLVRIYGGTQIMFVQLLIGALLLMPTIVVVPTVPTSQDVLLLLLLGIVTTAVAHTMMLSSFKSLTIRSAMVISNTNPVYATLLAFLFLGEVPTLRVLAGGTLVVGAVVFESMRKGD